MFINKEKCVMCGQCVPYCPIGCIFEGDGVMEIDYDEFINYATDYIENNIAEDLSVKNLCKTLHVSKNILYKKFEEFYGCTVNEYITKRRLQKAERMLRDTRENIAAISEAVGFYNYTYFSKLFKASTGLTPSEYRKHAMKK